MRTESWQTSGARGALAVAVLFCAGQALAQSAALPVIGFASLKTDRVDVRREPGLDKAVTVVFRRAGLPVQVLQDAHGWHRVQDADGTTGWVPSDLVSKRRTALVLAGAESGGTVALRSSSRAGADAVAYLEPGVIVGLVGCDGQGCRISAGGVRGYVEQRMLWGLAAGEIIR